MDGAPFGLEFEREDDGRWIAEIVSLPGVLAYGLTQDEAIAKAKALALRVIADRIEHGEAVPEIDGLFSAA
ncbi:MAG TPA: type II toxin-antitoxin system HicB family antitoxin [Chloroflexota bacterium]|jgi:predicted RNase H-like HicB family nuclease